ncbi:MAG: DUF4430 domain-containing protein [Oscillospiraceae bacterium]|nr:DUF4430 domain-containing protein [Oscillospiraceae bacterium]
MKRRIIVTLLVLFLLFTVAACGGASPGPAPPADAVQTIGQGATTFRFEVTDPAEAVTAWDVSTDETTVGAALLAVGLISGDESEWGLMVTTVNGITADWDANQAFWAFYIDGDFAMAGADATDIEPGVTYAFVYTAG